MKINSIIFLIVGLVLVSVVSAESGYLGIYKLGEDIRLNQVCSDASYINISSITYPDSTIAISNVAMTNLGNGEFNYTFENVTMNGIYSVCGISDGCEITFCYKFEVNPVGEELTIGKSVGYIGLIIFLFCLFLLSLVSIFRFKNFIAVFIISWVTYLLFFAITFICYQITDSYFYNVEFLGTFFWIIYWILLIATFPLFLCSMAYLFYIIAYNDHFRKLVEKGMSTEEAMKFSDREINPFRSSRRR